MSERDTIEKVKSNQGLMSKLQDILFFGKGTREDLKELDKQMREDYHEELLDLRHRWEDAYLQALEEGQAPLGRRFKTVIQTCDRVTGQIDRASYGYAPFFNRRGQIEDVELARVYNHDKAIAEQLDRLRDIVEKVSASVAAGDWRAVSEGVDGVRALLEDLERKWGEREKLFRSKEV